MSKKMSLFVVTMYVHGERNEIIGSYCVELKAMSAKAAMRMASQGKRNRTDTIASVERY